ncbi:MAG TPA: hypothetical protein VHN18_15555, partial [Micromonosporaceae bacterium]|nr:hypothetical protein [Micromonosporaceae bacterium]
IVLAAVYILWAYERVFTGAGVMPGRGDGATVAGPGGLGAPGVPGGGSSASVHERALLGDGGSGSGDGGGAGRAAGRRTGATSTAVLDSHDVPVGGTTVGGTTTGGGTTGATRAGATAVLAPDLGRREIGAIAPLVLALVLFGFFPMPLLDVSNPAADTILERAGVRDDAPVVPATGQNSSEEGQK